MCEFQPNVTEVCFQWSSEQYVNIGSDNGLSPNRWQAIIWTNVDAAKRSYGVTKWQWVKGASLQYLVFFIEKNTTYMEDVFCDISAILIHGEC